MLQGGAARRGLAPQFVFGEEQKQGSIQAGCARSMGV